MKLIIMYIAIISLIAYLSSKGVGGILNTALRIKNFVVSHPAFIGFIGFLGESFTNVSASIMAITVAALLVKKAVGEYTYTDLAVFFIAGLTMSVVGWAMKLWYNKNKK